MSHSGGGLNRTAHEGQCQRWHKVLHHTWLYPCRFPNLGPPAWALSFCESFILLCVWACFWLHWKDCGLSMQMIKLTIGIRIFPSCCILLHWFWSLKKILLSNHCTTYFVQCKNKKSCIFSYFLANWKWIHLILFIIIFFLSLNIIIILFSYF